MLSAGYSWRKQHLSKQDNTRLNAASPFLLLTLDRPYNSINSLKKRTLPPLAPSSNTSHPTAFPVNSKQHNYRSFYDLDLRPISWYCKPFKCQLPSRQTLPALLGFICVLGKGKCFVRRWEIRFICGWVPSSPLLSRSHLPVCRCTWSLKLSWCKGTHWIFMQGPCLVTGSHFLELVAASPQVNLGLLAATILEPAQR